MTSYSWIGNGSGTGDWNDPTNWNDATSGNNGVPSSGDDANIATSDTITGDGSADTLTVSANPTFTGTITTSTSLYVQGGFTTVTSSGDLECSNSSDDAVATIEGELDVDGGTFHAEGGVNVQNFGTLDIYDTGSANLQQSSGVYAALSVDSGGNVYVSDNGTTLDSGGISIGYTDNGYMSVDGGATVIATSQDPADFAGLGLANDADTTGELDVTGGSTFTVSSGGVSVGFGGAAILMVEDSTFDDTDSSNGSMSLGAQDGASGTVDFDDSDISIAQTLIVGDDGNGTLTMEDASNVEVNALIIANGEDSGAAISGMAMVSDDDATLTIADALIVGEAGTGTLSISDGASVKADSLDVAVEEISGSPSEGTASDVMIDGDGTVLTINGDGSIGDAGYGTMELTGGATASFENLDIAVQASSGNADSTDDGQESQVTLDGSDTVLTVTDTLTVGDGGTGYLDVSGGATVMTDALIVAAQESSGIIGPDHDAGGVTGQPSGVYLHDSSTSLSVDGDAVVGGDGYGFINVFDGSSMSASSIDIAADETSGDPSSHDESYVEVNNADSTLSVDDDVTVGDGGFGGFTVFDGAFATIGGDLNIGKEATSGTADAPSFAGVQDADSSLKVSGTTTVGDSGNGSFYIGAGGTFTAGGNNIEVGKEADSSGIFEIDSDTATFDYSGALTIGDAGTGTFDLEDGATWTAQSDITLGVQETGVGSITITGDGSELTVQGNLTLGEAGTGNLTIGDSGDLTVDGNVYSGNSTVDIEGDPLFRGDLYLGIGTPAGGAGLATTGNAIWTLGGGTTLTVTGSVYMGVYAGDMGTLTVTGTDTQFIVQTDLIIGDAGTGTLNVQNAATTMVTGALTIGSQNGATGTLTVSNADSEVDAATLTDGDDGSGDATVSSGGELSIDGDTTLGSQSNGNGKVTVSDTQSNFDIGGNLTVGDAGGGQIVNDGNMSVSANLNVGAQSGSSGQVTISVGTLDVDGDTTIGDNGSGSVLVQLAGTFIAHDLKLADVLGSSGTLTVDGDGTTATTDDLTIGASGSGKLNVTDGASLTTSGDATLGDAVSANIDTAKVDTQANWGIDGDLTVGTSGIATLNVLGGGSVTDSGNVVFGDQSAASGEVTVSGSITNQTSGDTSASALNWGQTLTVGNAGYGTLTVSNGGLVAPSQGGSGEVDIAAKLGSTGSVTVTGAGSTLNAANMAIGGTLTAAGGTGSLAVSQGALADIAANVTMWGGTLDVSKGGQAVIGQAGIFRQEQDQLLIASGGVLTGHGTINGDATLSGGTIDATGGTLTINGTMSGNGTIDVGSGSTLDIAGDVSGAISIDLAAGATVELGGSFTDGASIQFEDANDGSSLGGQSVILQNPPSFFNDITAINYGDAVYQDTGAITGFAIGDQIVLQGMNYNAGDPVASATFGILNGEETLDVSKGFIVNGAVAPTGAPFTNGQLDDRITIDIPISGAGGAQFTNDYAAVSSVNSGQDTALALAPGNALDLSINGPIARQTYGVTGSGVIVGVISDSEEADAMADVVNTIAPGAQVIIDNVVNPNVNGPQQLADNINELVADGANVIVDDLGFHGAESGTALQTLDDAIDLAYAKGVTLVSAAGNDRPPLDHSIPVYGHQLDPYELSTAAMNLLATPSSVGGYLPETTDAYSSIGKVDITGPVGGTAPSLTLHNQNPFFGTSAAAPAVAAVAALMISEDPGLADDPGQLYQEIEDSALDFGEPADEEGHGLVQANAAVALATADRGNYFSQAPNGLNVVGVVLSHPGNATADSTEHLDLTLSEGVTIGGSGTPALVLNDGAQASYDQALSNPSNGTLVFDYNVGAADTTPNLAITGFDSDGVTIEDSASNNADFSGVFNVASGTSVNSPFAATSVTASETGEATSGQTVQLTLSLNEAAHVMPAGGDPTLSLSDGATAEYDANASDPANGQLVFDYQVGATDADPDLSVVAVNLPTGTTIQDGNGYNADFSDILVQPTGLQIGPTSLQALIANASGSADTGSHVQLMLAFSAPISLDTANGSPTLTLNDEETATYDPNASNLADGEIAFDYQVASSDQTADLAATSYNPNGSVLADQNGMAADLSALTGISTGLSINSALQATAATPSQTGEADTGTVLKITLGFNEAINLFAVDDSESPTLTLNDGATATFDAEGADGESLVFDYAVGSADQTPDLAISSVNLNGASLTDANGYNADFAAILNTPLYVSVNEDNQPCYCPGTLILSDKGDIPVETLAIGDRVLTVGGLSRSIKWIGRRSYSGRFVLGRKNILPVCIKAGALGESLPRRDLWISPHHAMYLDGVLIEAKDLVNGVSIVQAEHADEIIYIHVELDSHDVILAEGAWSETFLDESNRGMFHNAHEYHALYPQPQRDPQGRDRYYAPRLDEGFEVEHIRQNIAAIAGIAIQPEAHGPLRGFIDLVDAHWCADGRKIAITQTFLSAWRSTMVKLCSVMFWQIATVPISRKPVSAAAGMLLLSGCPQQKPTHHRTLSSRGRWTDHALL